MAQDQAYQRCNRPSGFRAEAPRTVRWHLERDETDDWMSEYRALKESGVEFDGEPEVHTAPAS